MRPEIQALRALAVTAVVLFHYWPVLVPGGQVGVDVFFVVSGFLITGILLREADAQGRIWVPGFYLRRARRLLPSALLVLIVSAVATVVFVRTSYWEALFREIGASALNVQNWNLLIAEAVPDTIGPNISPLQHFWSLSVEEQFYLAWPGLIILALLLGRRWFSGSRYTLYAVLGTVIVLSFAYNIWQTGAHSTTAYFSTLARAWEFGLGGMLALAPSCRLPAVWRAVLSWGGLAAIVVSLFAASDPRTFPGWIVLLPVLGTMAVVWSGVSGLAGGTDAIARFPLVQWLGGISYALYLWHWPVLVFTPAITGVATPSSFMVLLLGGSVLLAWATTRWLEDPIRARARRTRPANSPYLSSTS